LYFKSLLSIIILKLNKISCDSPKSFWPIILINILGKLIEKVIGRRLQFHLISNNFIYPNQLGNLKQHSTTDADIFLTHLIWLEWVKNLQTSTLVMVHWNTSIFLFFYLFFLIWYFFSFGFSSLFMILDNKEAHNCSYVTCDMMWGHRSKF